MRLCNYLLEEELGRSKTIDEEEALHLAWDNCSDALESLFNDPNSTIYRDFVFDGAMAHPYMYIEPSKYERKSRNTQNYYTLLIDNSNNWKRYPKRSKSIICGTGNVSSQYIVLPFDGSKIGVCSDRDMWESFDLYSECKLGDLKDLNIVLRNIMEKANKEGRFDTDLGTFKKTLKAVDDKIEAVSERVGGREHLLIDYYKKSGYKSLWDYLEYLLEPKRNSFELKKIGDKLPTNREVWTDGNSVLVNSGEYKEFMKKIRYRFGNEDL